MKYFCFLLSAFLIFFVTPAFAAALPDTSDHAFSDGFDTLTISSYVVTGSNTLALCGVAANHGAPPVTASVTWNGGAMDIIAEVTPYTTFLYSAWKLVGVSGTHDFVLTANDNGRLGLGCSTFTGVDQTTPVGSYATAADPDNITLTVPANGLAWDFGGKHYDSGDPCPGNSVPGVDQTELFSECADLTLDTSIMSSYRTTSGDFTWSPIYWVQFGVPINPVAETSGRRRVIVAQ